MKVLHLEYSQYPKEAIQKLTALADVEPFECNNQQELYSKLVNSKYDAIFTRLGLMMDERVMDLQPDLKCIVTSTTGLNHIDTNAAFNRKINVISLKGETEFLANVKSTAEHAWGLVLSLIRNLPGAVEHVKQGGWDRVPYLSDELDSKLLGIIGFGRLGKIISNYAKAFGMNVQVYDHHPENYHGYSDVQPVTLKNLLKQADVIMLLISWTDSNSKFMNSEMFSMMKPSSYFINVARGELVDEAALLKALSDKRIKGAALDVLQDDSAWAGKVMGSEALIAYAKSHSNCLITPHMGGYGKDSIAKTRTFVTDKFLSLIKNK